MHSVYFRKFCTQSNIRFWKIFQLHRINDENKKYTAVCLEASEFLYCHVGCEKSPFLPANCFGFLASHCQERRQPYL